MDKPPVQRVSEYERIAGGFRPARAAELLGVKTDRYLRMLRKDGKLRKKGRLYTYASVRDLNAARVKDGALSPEYLDLFVAETAEAAA